jgi:hypothetical protein
MTATRFAGGALATMFLASLVISASQASPIYVGPGTGARALYGRFNDTDPWGRPARPGCTWSRMQMPTARGQQWVTVEDSDTDRRT